MFKSDNFNDNFCDMQLKIFEIYTFVRLLIYLNYEFFEMNNYPNDNERLAKSIIYSLCEHILNLLNKHRNILNDFYHWYRENAE